LASLEEDFLLGSSGCDERSVATAHGWFIFLEGWVLDDWPAVLSSILNTLEGATGPINSCVTPSVLGTFSNGLPVVSKP
jgi:hypothetical protein